jgi:hypothetical protein
MRGQRNKQTAEEAKVAGNAVEVIDVSEHESRPKKLVCGDLLWS